MKTKKRRVSVAFLLCRRRDSNPHVFKGHRILSPARLPVPPLRLMNSHGACERRDLNPHALRHRLLRPARLPFRHSRKNENANITCFSVLENLFLHVVGRLKVSAVSGFVDVGMTEQDKFIALFEPLRARGGKSRFHTHGLGFENAVGNG